MSTRAFEGSEQALGGRPKTRGEVYEGIAFSFCKTATIVLIAQRFALPLAAGAAAAFYVLAYWQGKKDTRCVARYPLAIATFWGAVAVLSVYLTVRPMLFR